MALFGNRLTRTLLILPLPCTKLHHHPQNHHHHKLHFHCLIPPHPPLPPLPPLQSSPTPHLLIPSSPPRTLTQEPTNPPSRIPAPPYHQTGVTRKWAGRGNGRRRGRRVGVARETWSRSLPDDYSAGSPTPPEPVGRGGHECGWEGKFRGEL